MIKTDIGEIAGYIWHHLDKAGETRVSVVREEIKKKYSIDDLRFTLALGWLMRENNIRVTVDTENFEASKIKLQ